MGQSPRDMTLQHVPSCEPTLNQTSKQGTWPFGVLVKNGRFWNKFPYVHSNHFPNRFTFEH